MRKSVVIHRFIRASGSGKERAAAHIRYIQFRPGRDRDKCGEAGRPFFSEGREDIQGWRVIERIREQEDSGILVHKFTLSPGINGFDAVDYTREVMGEFGRSKGWDLEYYGTNHGNTEHDHIHMVVIGKDKNGREVWIDGKKDYAVLRELGDRYIERYHNLDRYLDRELHDLIKNGPIHQRGDALFEQMWKDLNKLNQWGEPEPPGKEPYPQYEDEVQGDAKYRQLIADLTKRKSADDAKENKEEEREEKVDEAKEARRLKLVEETPEEERIQAGNGKFYTKHHTLKELEKYDDDLNKGREERLEYETYQLLWKWIGTKETGGDDYYERTGETERLKQQFDDDFERSIRPSSTERIRSKGYQQYSIESRGRLLETHEHMQTVYFRHQLKEELKELDDSGVDEPERRKEILEKLDWLNELSQALREPQVKIINKEKEVKKVKEANEAKEERHDKAPEKDLSKSERRELEQWRQGDQKDRPREHDQGKEKASGRLSESEQKELEKWRNSDEREQPPEHDKQEELDREEREREEIARAEAEEEKAWRDEYDRREREDVSDRERQEEERAQQEQEREEQERQEREGREEEAADRRRREEEDKEREDDERRVEEFKRIDEAKLRERDDAETEERMRRDEEEREEQRRTEKQQKDERERTFRLQQELEKLKQQQLEPGRDSKGDSGPSRLQEKIDQYEQEIANGNKRSLGERQAGDKAEPSSLDLAEPTLDLDKGIEENWSLDEKAGPDEHEIDDLLNGLDREEAKDRAEIEDTATGSLFGEEVEKALEQFEKTPEEERIASWEENAFNPELIKDQQERPDQQMEKALLGDETERSSQLEQQEQQEVQKTQDQQMQQQIQDSVQIHIERAFLDPGQEVNDKDDRDQSQDRDDDGRGR